MRRLLRWVGALAALAILLVTIAAIGAYLVLRNTVPSFSGALAIAGLSSPVEITRDREAVPHIFARTVDDAFAALGFVHAQDRLWQMELARRAGQGRLSEMFGEQTYTTDVFLRTLDLYGHAERSLAVDGVRGREPPHLFRRAPGRRAGVAARPPDPRGREAGGR